ncbi:hypothetical protein OG792_12530 [Micromonospora sp. NBC_01699]|uniref:hypothetical protein n=1 Tax=Micromonospora sp. NBC_01699 TaxID=2975984 RepID=UPI002E364E15|nr:hypothetical protein [Micromonospora sp. NBC_01699]
MAVPPAPTDQELDVYIRTRYALLGIDISVLPENDPAAPMDQERVFASARSVIRQDPVIAAYPTDQQADVPTFYPVQLAQWTGALDD